MKNFFVNEREIAFLDIVPAKGMCEDNPERRRGIKSSLWVPIFSMRGKFPTGIYYLNGFLQANPMGPRGIYVASIQGFALSPSLRFGDASIFSV